MEQQQLDLDTLKEWYRSNTHESPLVVRQVLMKEIERLSQKEKTLEQRLLQWCVEYVYTQCVDDNSILDLVGELTTLTEFELMSGFESISQDLGFDLDEKVDGVWKTRKE